MRTQPPKANVNAGSELRVTVTVTVNGDGAQHRRGKIVETLSALSRTAEAMANVLLRGAAATWRMVGVVSCWHC